MVGATFAHRMETPASIRIDKWLWAARLYKSRSLATQACLAGHVKMDGHNVKPAREVRAGDVVSARTGFVQRTVRIIAVLDKRVGAKLVGEYLEDLTPDEEYEKARQHRAQPVVKFPKGWGRPTKKNRRELEGFMRKNREGEG